MPRDRHHFAVGLALFAAALTPAVASAATPESSRVLEAGARPSDRRLEELKDLDGYFPFEVPQTRAAWEARAESLRRRVLVATGLWPLPTRTPLNPVIHGRVRRDGFTVEKVYFESLPDHYVTGLLFRPQGASGPRPAVLCPHGHGGRLQDYGEEEIRELVTQGAERFLDCGRFPKLSRSAQLARMGCVTFIFDMVGYADSQQISYELAHRFAEQRPQAEDEQRWGFYSTQAELRMQSIMGLQIWNAVRRLDFLVSLPDVDPQRVGVTGGSGGGTQSILLGAIDPRPVVAFPQGMVSTSMQGGCTCENCCLLRIGTGNVELAALFAPRPQAMTAADDWTRAMMTQGYPQLKELYTLLGVPELVQCTDLTHFPHNYNYVTRALMYSWFNRHLQLGLEEPIVEAHWEPLTEEEWTVWNEEHPAPEAGLDYEYQITRWLADDADRKLQSLQPDRGGSRSEFRRVVGGAFRTLVGRELAETGAVEREKVDKQSRPGYLSFKDLVRLPRHGEELPVVSFYPTAVPWNGEVVVWLNDTGKAALFDAGGELIAPARRLLENGFSLVSADLLQQGEFLNGGEPPRQTRVVDNPREFAGFTFGYNHSLFVHRVHDILTLLAFVRSSEYAVDQIHVVGLDRTGPLVAAARAVSGDAIDKAAIGTGGFRFVDLKSYRDPQFLPGAVKYRDLPALLALSSPQDLWVAGEGSELPPIVRAAYEQAGASEALTAHGGGADRAPAAVVDWLLGEESP